MIDGGVVADEVTGVDGGENFVATDETKSVMAVRDAKTILAKRVGVTNINGAIDLVLPEFESELFLDFSLGIDDRAVAG